MVKWLFNGKLQMIVDRKEKWNFTHNFKGEYFDAETYKNFLSFGKVSFYWGLPTKEEIEAEIQENNF